MSGSQVREDPDVYVESIEHEMWIYNFDSNKLESVVSTTEAFARIYLEVLSSARDHLR